MTSKHPARWVLTARDGGNALSDQGPLPTAGDADDLPRVWVNTRRRFQVLEGFGGAFTEAATFSVNGTTEKPQVKDGVITVEQMTFAKGDPVCCPSVKKTVTYNFDGKTLTEK